MKTLASRRPLGHGFHLVLRADASDQIGTGHVMRCLALAQAWQRAGGQVRVASGKMPVLLRQRLNAEGINVDSIEAALGSNEDADHLVRLAREVGADWVVVDGYVFGEAYHRVLKDASLRLLLIDDFGFNHRCRADAVLNQNPWADESLYPTCSADTRLFLGPHFMLLRPEFLRWREWSRNVRETATRVLVTMGGSDPDDMTGNVIQALGESGATDWEVVVVLGPANPRQDELAATVRRGWLKARILPAQDDMASLMAWADIGVSATGGTAWELEFMGLPACGFALAPNQTAALRYHVERGCFVKPSSAEPKAIGEALLLLSADLELRQALSARGRRLVDGLGSPRVVQVLMDSAEPRRGEGGKVTA